MQVTVDEHSGFCPGVVSAIRKAEEQLSDAETLYCLGDIVHNSEEVSRLEQLGLRTIDHEQLAALHDKPVLIRAHGEPPSTYQVAEQNNIEIIDATCPVVLQLQKRIKRVYEESKTSDQGVQIVIYGKKGHAEVNGLVGQTEGTAIVVEGMQDLDKIDYARPVRLFSQTTMPVDAFRELAAIICRRMNDREDFQYRDTICRQVANRIPHLACVVRRIPAATSSAIPRNSSPRWSKALKPWGSVELHRLLNGRWRLFRIRFMIFFRKNKPLSIISAPKIWAFLSKTLYLQQSNIKY